MDKTLVRDIVEVHHTEEPSMHTKRLMAVAMLALAGVTSANATLVTINNSNYGVWQTFDVVDPTLGLGNNGLNWIDQNDGTDLSFSVTVADGFIGKLTVVDAGFSGDRFTVFSGISSLGNSSAAVNSYPNSIGLDFDAALANSNFSRGIYELAAGTYTITGSLLSSALDDANEPLNATVGALRVDVSPVPLPAAALLLLNGLGVFGLAARRRAAR
ncbi:MAG: VPLPA-CTERM sorting domain-containing protein [Burkholderiales bacterium]|jgi:hypothetical protein